MSVLKMPPSAPPFEGGDQNGLLAWMEANHRQFGSIFQSRVYGTGVYVINDLQYAEHVLQRNWRNYKKGLAIKRVGLLLGTGLMVSEGDLWKCQRRMIQPAFHDKAIERLTTMIVEANRALLERWELAVERSESVNVTRDISLVILEIILRVIFGDDYHRVAPQFSILSEKSERSLKFANEFRSLRHVVADVAARRRPKDNHSSDMLDVLMRARDRDTGDTMSEFQLVNEIMTLVVAGHETTASTLNWIWYLLSQHPDAEQKLHAEVTGGGLTYARQVIEEALRLYPPGWLMTRRPIHDDRLGDHFVPAGTEIYLSPYIIQRRADLWPDPHRFDPDRFGAGHMRQALAMLAFSAGPRNCIGENLARLEMPEHLCTIARRLRLRYLGDEPQLDLGVNLRSKNDFVMQPVQWNA